MDTFAALSLATDAPLEALLKRKPYGKNDALICPSMWRNIIGGVFYEGIIILLLVFLIGDENPDFQIDCSDKNLEHGEEHSYLLPRYYTESNLLMFKNGMCRRYLLHKKVYVWTYQHFAFVFNTFIFMQLFNLLTCRKCYNEVNFFENVHKNPLFIGIWIGCVAAQFIIMLVPGLQNIFSVYPITINLWGFSFLFSIMIIPWKFLLHLAMQMPDPFHGDIKMVKDPDVTHGVYRENALPPRKCKLPAMVVIRQEVKKAIVEEKEKEEELHERELKRRAEEEERKRLEEERIREEERRAREAAEKARQDAIEAERLAREKAERERREAQEAAEAAEAAEREAAEAAEREAAEAAEREAAEAAERERQKNEDDEEKTRSLNNDEEGKQQSLEESRTSYTPGVGDESYLEDGSSIASSTTPPKMDGEISASLKLAKFAEERRQKIEAEERQWEMEGDEDEDEDDTDEDKQTVPQDDGQSPDDLNNSTTTPKQRGRSTERSPRLASSLSRSRERSPKPQAVPGQPVSQALRLFLEEKKRMLEEEQRRKEELRKAREQEKARKNVDISLRKEGSVCSDMGKDEFRTFDEDSWSNSSATFDPSDSSTHRGSEGDDLGGGNDQQPDDDLN